MPPQRVERRRSRQPSRRGWVWASLASLATGGAGCVCLRAPFRATEGILARMQNRFVDGVKAYIGFTEVDAANLQTLADVGVPLIPRIVARFYEVALQHEDAREILADSAQSERLRVAFANWLRALFAGIYEDEYWEACGRIGNAHVRIGLPQRFMPLAMDVVWQTFRAGFTEGGIEAGDPRLASLQKLLCLNLTLMLESFQEDYAEQVREIEQRGMEAKLVRAEHLAEIGQLAASLAHEIKNPLAGISGAIQIIGESLDSKNPYKSIIRDILGQIGRLDATVKDLLLYARPSPPTRKEVRLAQLVARTVGLVREEPALRDVQVRFHGPDQAVEADEGQLEQLLLNLILNAAHASSKGGTIDIRADVRGARLALEVSDRGIGMPPHVLDRALEPFFTTKAKGTGLGLAICRRIAEAHGGSIRIESAPGQGTSVCVELPRKSEPVAARSV